MIHLPEITSVPARQKLVTTALKGLTASNVGSGGGMPYTLRGVPGPHGPELRPEGDSLRYTAIAALGLGRRPLLVQREVLAGSDAAQLARTCAALAANSTDAGAIALSLWAAAEVAGETDAALAQRLLAAVRGRSVATVDCAWALIAALALPEDLTAVTLAREAATLLLAHQGPSGIFPHVLPPRGAVRGHVGSFADQIYPIQALARFAARTGDARALASAKATAARIVGAQGAGGQWWWHYDVRNGAVVERYPVYSVHQHGMAPMVLCELDEFAGTDHREAVERGFGWLAAHPECVEPLIEPALGVIWRKVGRREPPKASRAVGAVASRLRPGVDTAVFDRVWPPGRVDYECRPYELGWLLYAAGPSIAGEGRTP